MHQDIYLSRSAVGRCCTHQKQNQIADPCDEPGDRDRENSKARERHARHSLRPPAIAKGIDETLIEIDPLITG